jgi:hypothetical protein
VRYAQSKGLSLKVSDEFTVPLCAIHHQQIHATGKENAWWQNRNIDPLKVAAALWQQSRQRSQAPPNANPASQSEGDRPIETAHVSEPDSVQGASTSSTAEQVGSTNYEL